MEAAHVGSGSNGAPRGQESLINRLGTRSAEPASAWARVGALHWNTAHLG